MLAKAKYILPPFPYKLKYGLVSYIFIVYFFFKIKWLWELMRVVHNEVLCIFYNRGDFRIGWRKAQF